MIEKCGKGAYVAASVAVALSPIATIAGEGGYRANYVAMNSTLTSFSNQFLRESFGIGVNAFFFRQLSGDRKNRLEGDHVFASFQFSL